MNSRLLDHGEVQTILTEVKNLPYQNTVEALEFSRPSVLTNGTALLYILAMPKIAPKDYRLLHLLSATHGGKQVMVKHDKVAVTTEETYAVVDDCLSIGNTTVCPEKNLLKLDKSGCIPRLLKGDQAKCELLRNNMARIELVEDGTLFLSNFNGTMKAGSRTYNLAGTYIVQFVNETISVAGRTYTSYTSTHFTVMPAVLTSVTATGHAPSLNYINDFNMENLKRLFGMSEKVSFSFLVEALVPWLSVWPYTPYGGS